MDFFSRRGRLLFAAESYALLLIFLLPLKFGAIVGLPSITMIYWREWFPLIISPWPSTLFPLLSAILLLVTLFCVPVNPERTPRMTFALFWAILAGLSPLGAFAQNVIVNYPMHMIPYCFGLASLAMSLSILLDCHPSFANRILSVTALAAVFSLYSAMSQYLTGFDMTLEQIKKMEAETGIAFHGNMKSRLMEQRISADFSACNAYAGYLLLVIPILLAGLWKLGSRVTPPLLSRLLFTIPLFLLALYVLIHTGSRGAILSGGTMLIFCLLCLKLPKRWKYAIWSLIPLGAAAFGLLIYLGRGVGSMIFRFDYYQAAFRMMLESPLIGKGWGGFVRDYLTMKLLTNDESPNSPHNLILTFGSQLGIVAFLISVMIVAIMFLCCLRALKNRTPADVLSDTSILQTAAVYGLAAWTFHSMMEVSFETPGSMGLAIVITLAVLTFSEQQKSKNEDQPEPKNSILWKITVVLLSCVLIICTLVTDLKLIHFELAYEQLNNLTDPRFTNGTESKLPPDPASVQKSVQECDRIANRSPYQQMLLSNYYLATRDRENALKALNEALKRAPSFASLHFRKYQLLKEAPARADDAKKSLETAQKLSPKNPKYKEE